MFCGILLAVLAAGCAEFPGREGTPIATSDCRVGELGWWEGPLTRCPFNRLVRERRPIRADQVSEDD